MRNKFSSRLDTKVLGVYSRTGVAEGRRALYRKILGADGSLVIAGEGFEYFRLEDLSPSSWLKTYEKASATSLAVHCQLLKRKWPWESFLGLAKRAQKTKLSKLWQKLEFFVFNWRRIGVLVNVSSNRWSLWFFRPLRVFDFWQFFDFLTTFQPTLWPTCHYHQPHHAWPQFGLC